MASLADRIGTSQNTPTDRAIQRWLAATVDFGGEIMSRADVYRWFAAEGYPRKAADLWLVGYENTRKGSS